MSEITALSGLIGMAAVLMLCYLFISAQAITFWSGPRAGPKWATFFGYMNPSEGPIKYPRLNAGVLALFALAFEGGSAYIALHPEFLPPGGSFVLALQIVLAAVWTVFFFRLPMRSVRREM